MGMRTLIGLAGVLLMTAGCRTAKPEVPVAVTSEMVPIVYTIGEGLKVKVTFESPRAYNATQLGLALFNKHKKEGKLLRVDDPAFFPEYFAIINVDIEDGLLFVSDEEAYMFAQRIFRAYQRQITPPEMLKGIRKARILEDIMISDPGVKPKKK